jgi:hypothetical protein
MHQYIEEPCNFYKNHFTDINKMAVQSELVGGGYVGLAQFTDLYSEHVLKDAEHRFL